ncbi:MAG: hypothetical protein F6K26_35835 [Moorea sp. SIO2I5]|nr:hypothetical protein [Moorena sp. SIO2I5]
MQQAYQACCPNELWDYWEDEIPDTLVEILKILDYLPKYNDNEKPILKFVYRLLQTGEITNLIADQLKQWL